MTDTVGTIRRDQIAGRIAVKTDHRYCPWMVFDPAVEEFDAAPESYVMGWQVVYRPDEVAS